MAKETIVLYFFQGEVGESIDSPNAFITNSSGPLTFGDFLRNFPLRDPSLHYRFQVEDSKFGYVWKDIKSPTETLPTKGGIVTTKILKLDTVSCLKRKSNLRLKTTMKFAESSELSPAPIQTNAKRDIPNKPTKKEGSDSQRKQAPVASETKPKAQQPAAAASKQEQSSAQPPRRPKPEVKEANLLDGDDGPSQVQKVQTKSSPSPVSVQSPATVPVPTPTPAPEPAVKTPPTPPPPPLEPVLSREELVAKREALVQEQVDAALKEKRERDEIREKEERELEEARAKHDRLLTAWATDNGLKRNVRTLLSTMHTVIWPDSRWKQIGLGDVLTPAQVKLAYRKAMLVVHTDKLSKLDVEKKFIGKRIFEAINEAYTEFLEKEDV